MALESEIKTLITADNSQFKSRMRESTQAAKNFSDSAVSSFNKLKNALGAGIMGASFLSSMKEGYESLDRLTASAERLGISSSGFQELEYAAKRSDVEIGSLEQSIKKLRRSLATSSSANVLASIGLDRASLNKMGTEQAFETIIKKLKTLDNSTKIDIGTKLFGKGFQDILSLVNNDLDAFKKKFQELGGAVNTSGFDKMDEQVDNLEQSLTQLQRRLFLTFGGPGIELTTKFLNTLQTEGSKWGQTAANIADSISGINDSVTKTPSPGRPQDPLLGGLYDMQVNQQRSSSRLTGNSSSNAVSGIEAASKGIFALANASEVASSALKSFGQAAAMKDLKDTFGLNGQSGKQYLDTILEPITEIQDKYFTDLANTVRGLISRGANLNGALLNSKIATMGNIAHSYDNAGEGKTNSGMVNAYELIKKQVEAAASKTDQKSVLEIKVDENGMMKVFASSSDAMKIVGDVVINTVRKESSSVMASGG